MISSFEKVCVKTKLNIILSEGFLSGADKKTFTLEDEILNAGLTFEKLEKKFANLTHPPTN